MRIKKIGSIILTLALCAGMLSGCGNTSSGNDSAKGVKMYMTVSSSDTFRQNLMDEAKKVAEEMGAEIKQVDAEGSLENQMAQIREAVDGGYDVILCNPVDVDTTLQLGRSNALKAVLDDSGKKINYVYDDYADWDLDTAKAQFDVFLKTGQKVDVVACNNDNMALGVLQSCEEHGISPDEITIVGVDATDVGCAAIEEDKMAFTVYQSATGQGTYAVKAAARLAQGKSLKGLDYLSDDHKYVWVPFEKVDKSNVDDYK